MVVQGNLLSFEPSKMSLYCNTLQAIASGYLIAAICLLHLSVRWQVAVTGLLLVVYWLVMKFVPFPTPRWVLVRQECLSREEIWPCCWINT